MNVAIIGTGVGIRTHLAGLNLLGDVTVVGLVGSTVERARKHLADNGMNPELAVPIAKVLHSPPDMICLTTPPGERYQYLEMLTDFRGTVLIEKPMALTGPEAEATAQMLSRASRVIIDFQLRGLPAFMWVRELVQSRALGEVYSMALYERTSAFRKDHIEKWQKSRATGGGQAYAMGSHLIDLAVFLSGQGYADVRNPSGELDTPRGSWIHSDLTKSTSDEVFSGRCSIDHCEVEIMTSAISPAERTLEFRIEGTEGAVEFRYRNGRGEFETALADGKSSWRLGSDGHQHKADREVPGLDSSLFRVAYPLYAEAICHSGGGEMLATGDDGVSNSRILDEMVGNA